MTLCDPTPPIAFLNVMHGCRSFTITSTFIISQALKMEEEIAFLSPIQMFGIPFLSSIRKHVPLTNDLVFSSLTWGNFYQLFKVDENGMSSINIVEATL